MKQEQFYRHWNIGPFSKEQRLVKDLRDGDFTWQQIYDVFLRLESSPYDWHIKAFNLDQWEDDEIQAGLAQQQAQTEEQQ